MMEEGPRTRPTHRHLASTPRLRPLVTEQAELGLAPPRHIDGENSPRRSRAWRGVTGKEIATARKLLIHTLLNGIPARTNARPRVGPDHQRAKDNRLKLSGIEDSPSLKDYPAPMEASCREALRKRAARKRVASEWSLPREICPCRGRPFSAR